MISTISVMAITASLVISTVALANSMIFEQSVYGVDNCDPISTCNSVGSASDAQTNDCIIFSDCQNIANGGLNNQNNGCRTSFCSNAAFYRWRFK